MSSLTFIFQRKYCIVLRAHFLLQTAYLSLHFFILFPFLCSRLPLSCIFHILCFFLFLFWAYVMRKKFIYIWCAMNCSLFSMLFSHFPRAPAGPPPHVFFLSSNYVLFFYFTIRIIWRNSFVSFISFTSSELNAWRWIKYWKFSWFLLYNEDNSN